MNSGLKTNSRVSFRRVISAMALLAAVPYASAVPLYDEAVNGDLSGNHLAPTPIIVSNGINEVWGVTGKPSSTAPAADRDYLTFNVPAGQMVVAIAVLQEKTGIAGNLYFLGVQDSTEITVAPTAFSSAGLIGFTHFKFDSGNIISDLGLPNGATTLGAGSYSFWIQETGAVNSEYGLAIQLADVPEMGPGLMTSVGAIGCMLVAARRRAKAC